MSKHHGKIVEYAVRRNGYNLSALAKYLKVNRRSLYNWFGSEVIKKPTIHQIGIIIRHDFSSEFPEMFTSKDFEVIHAKKAVEHEPPSTNGYWQLKYIQLLERYNMLLTKASQPRMHGNQF